MGHQTFVTECKKCKGITINTIAFGKKITSTNCKCKIINKPQKKQ